MATIRIGDLAAKIKKADAGHYYISVAKKDGKFRTSQVKLTGAEKMFLKDSNFIYVRSIRHAGNRQDLREYLMAAGFKDSDIDTYLNDCYSPENISRLSKDYHKEVAKIPSVASPTRAKSPRPNMSKDEIFSLGKSLEKFKFENKPRPTSPVPTTPKLSATGKSDLKTRLSGLSEDKVLDISGFNIEKKNGIKTITRPTKVGSKHSVGNTNDLKKIFFDFSKPVENGIAALVSLGFTQERASKVMNAPHNTKWNDLKSIAIKH